MMSRIAKNCFVLSSQSFRGPAGRRRWNSRSAVYSAPGQFIRGRISGVPSRLRKFCFSAALCGEGTAIRLRFVPAGGPDQQRYGLFRLSKPIVLGAPCPG